MLKKINLIFTLLAMLFILSSCGEGYGGFLGFPGFLFDPILYANTEVDHEVIDLGVRDVYAVRYTDTAGTPLNDTVWVYFVPKSYNMESIRNGTLESFVALRVNDADQAIAKTQYSIMQTLITSNFMVWMDIADGGALYTGDTIELAFDKISKTEGATIKGEFTSTLHRGSSLGLAEKFKFEAPVNFLVGSAFIQ